jgi:hypothetical protein
MPGGRCRIRPRDRQWGRGLESAELGSPGRLFDQVTPSIWKGFAPRTIAQFSMRIATLKLVFRPRKDGANRPAFSGVQYCTRARTESFVRANVTASPPAVRLTRPGTPRERSAGPRCWYARPNVGGALLRLTRLPLQPRCDRSRALPPRNAKARHDRSA